MKGFLKYLVLAPWVYLKKDRLEYKNLLALISTAEKETQSAKDKITRTYFDENEDGISCIKKYKIFVQNKFEPEYSFEYREEKQCPYFLDCTKRACLFYKARSDYFEKLAKQSDLYKQRNNFWVNKVEKVK